MRKNTLAIVISSLLMAAATQAQPAPTAESPSTSSEATQDTTSYEADQSNRSDASAMAQQRWSEADTDRNGTLSQAEMQVSMPTIAANFSQMDVNGDGQLSQDEMHSFNNNASDKGQWQQSFKAADTNGDGALTLAEAQAQSGMPMLSSHFSTIDADKDGKVTSQELAKHHGSMHGSDSSMDADSSTRSSTTTTSTETKTDATKDDTSN